MKKTYITDRLILSTLKPSNANSIKVLDYYERNKFFLQPFEPNRDDFFYTPQYHKRNLNIEYTLINNLSLLRLWIFKIDDCKLERIIGTLSFSNIIRGAFQSCTLGYKLDYNETNKGYMTEALNKGLQIIFNEYKLHRVEANVMPKNIPSIKLLKKLGFNEEGFSKKYLKINNNWEDHFRMALLSENV